MKGRQCQLRIASVLTNAHGPGTECPVPRRDLQWMPTVPLTDSISFAESYTTPSLTTYLTFSQGRARDVQDRSLRILHRISRARRLQPLMILPIQFGSTVSLAYGDD